MHSFKVGLRDSPLSRAQLREFQALIQLELIPTYVRTLGDRDRATSLRSLDKSDFFTREIDQMVMEGLCDMGLHAAKDLPEPLPQGLICAAITRGVDSRDVLVHRGSLPPGATVATSSLRREAAVKQWRPDLRIVDIRGNVDERLAQLDGGAVDGLVVAEAALIRLGQTVRPRIYLEGEVAPLQGKLAVVIREGDQPLAQLLKPLHAP
jgi:hydroxymethylbilane synthase